MERYSITKQDGTVRYTDTVEQVSFEIPEDDFAGLIFGREMPPITDPDAYRRAVVSPMSGDCLRDIVAKTGAKSACLLVSDATRGVPTRLVSGHIVDELAAAGIPPEKVTFIVGVGLHRQPTDAEYRELVEERLFDKVTMISSNPFDENLTIQIGTSSRGTPVEVDRRAVACDLHITIGKTQLHGMAGFSGGPKAVLPGIASYKTILMNHSPQMISDPKTIRGQLEGNPFHIEMREAAEMLGVQFGVSFVVNDDNQPAAVYAGDMMAAHQASIDFLRQYVDVSLPEKPDIIVVTPGEPFNQNFYQASRAMRQLNAILDENVVLAFYAGCPEGLQSEAMMLPFQNTATVDEAEKYMWDNWDVQMDDSLFFIKTLRTNAAFLCYSPGVPREVFETMHCQSCDGYDEFMATAYRLSGKTHPRVMFFPMCQQYFTTL